MRQTAALRWSGAYVALPVLFSLTCVVGVGYGMPSGYPSDDLASTGLALYLAGPLLAAMTALRFRAFPRSLRGLRTNRNGVGVVGTAFWPLLLGGPACICAGIVITAREVPDDKLSLILLAVFFCTAIACAMTGVVCSWALPVVVAVPVAAGAWFAWLAYVPADGGVLLQNLDPTFAACCSPAMQPAADALAGGLAVATMMSLGYLGLLCSNSWPERSRVLVALAAIVVVAVALGGGAAVVNWWGEPPTIQSVTPRTTDLVCRTHRGLEICLWPEQAGRAGQVSAVAAQLNGVLARWRLKPITAISQRPAGHGAVAVNADRRLTQEDIQYSLAAGYVDSMARCRGSYGRWTAQRVVMILLGSGQTESDLRPRVEPSAVSAAATRFREFRSHPERMPAWFEGDRASIRCGSPS